MGLTNGDSKLLVNGELGGNSRQKIINSPAKVENDILVPFLYGPFSGIVHNKFNGCDYSLPCFN